MYTRQMVMVATQSAFVRVATQLWKDRVFALACHVAHRNYALYFFASKVLTKLRKRDYARAHHAPHA